ncbi:anaerobic ribonucleoside-triphosphate reductase activating protein [Flavobacteriaceae bacterium 3-367]|uniref:anaerobic ribonucleoside-triphosphate reductase activating protein n=1 Tax=Eudoraea algarum TaxID=3417568 RepID=UPI00327CC081
MHYYDFNVVLQEVPGELSLCFTISGCPLQCDGCHSPFLWKKGSGKKLTQQVYGAILEQYRGLASCVVFMGGEWHKKELIAHLKYAKTKGFKTCLYTGEENVDVRILEQLTWIKTGKWDKKYGGLDSKTTNQKFKNVKSNAILNHLFIHN